MDASAISHIINEMAFLKNLYLVGSTSILDEANEKNLEIDHLTSRVKITAPTMMMTITTISLVSEFENSIIDLSCKGAFIAKDFHAKNKIRLCRRVLKATPKNVLSIFLWIGEPLMV